jgi:hypothetical protein
MKIKPAAANFKQTLFFFGFLPQNKLLQQQQQHQPTEDEVSSIISKDIYVQTGNYGQNYLIFGNQHLPAKLNLSTSNNNNNVIQLKHGISLNDSILRSIDNSGDINSDQHKDLIIGDPVHSRVYVFFGSKNNYLITSEFGFTIRGEESTTSPDFFGWSIASGFDFNQDGYDDILVGALLGNKCYLIFGKDSSDSIGVSSLNDGKKGFAIIGNNNKISKLGMSVSSAGDFNGDGFHDVIFSGVALSAQAQQGIIFILFGTKTPPTQLLLDDLLLSSSASRRQGIVIYGESLSFAGISLSWLGDVNDDGLDDVIIGSLPFKRNGYVTQESWLLYGNRNETLLHKLLLTESTFLKNEKLGSHIIGGGIVVSGPSDLNNDGINDIMVTNFPDWKEKSGVFMVEYPNQFTAPPSVQPTSSPSEFEFTEEPTFSPTESPTVVSTPFPSPLPSFPATAPTVTPTFAPSGPTAVPSFAPSTPSSWPSSSPTRVTKTPSFKPTKPPVPPPTRAPKSSRPTEVTLSPTVLPSFRPTTKTPAVSPTIKPTTMKPSLSPTAVPTLRGTASSSSSSNEPNDGFMVVTVSDKGTDSSSPSSNGGQKRQYIFSTSIHNETITITGEGEVNKYSFQSSTASSSSSQITRDLSLMVIITNFRPSQDILDLSAFQFGVHNKLEDLMYLDDPLTIILPPDGQETIRLNGLTSADLSSMQFIFSNHSNTNPSTPLPVTEINPSSVLSSSAFDFLSVKIILVIACAIGLLFSTFVCFYLSGRSHVQGNSRKNIFLINRKNQLAQSFGSFNQVAPAAASSSISSIERNYQNNLIMNSTNSNHLYNFDNGNNNNHKTSRRGNDARISYLERIESQTMYSDSGAEDREDDDDEETESDGENEEISRNPNDRTHRSAFHSSYSDFSLNFPSRHNNSSSSRSHSSSSSSSRSNRNGGNRASSHSFKTSSPIQSHSHHSSSTSSSSSSAPAALSTHSNKSSSHSDSTSFHSSNSAAHSSSLSSRSFQSFHSFNSL